jgi:NAD(P)-dependent dehydrogenase (short-subunit alcohol dehydrogenase family)
VVLTTRNSANAAALEQAIRAQGGDSMIVELDLVSPASISQAFATIRAHVGDPDVVIYNAGYLEGRELPPEKELLEHIPLELFDTAQHIASRGPFLVASDESREDRGGVLLPSHPRQILLDARTPIDAFCDQAELLGGFCCKFSQR